MAGRIIYLEVDDEITSAAARIRDSGTAQIAVVLPYGSRVATSRINFRLLSRDALTHDKRLSIVSGDAATRALAASAGLPVFASVAEYESSLAGIDDAGGAGPAMSAAAGAAMPAGVATTAPAAAAPAMEAVTPRPPGGSDGTLGLVEPASNGSSLAAGVADGVAAAAVTSPVAPPGDTIRTTVPRDSPFDGLRPERGGWGPPATGDARPASASGRRGRVRTPWLIGGAILALALLVAGVGAYLLVPSASIVVTTRPEGAGPVDVTVTADTTASGPDASALVVPAQEVSLPVAVNGTFDATGKRVQLTNATGTVRFENLDPTSSNRIVSGSIVKTGSGVRFRTAVTITVPKAELVGLTIFPARASVKVTAVDGGPDGNVDPGTIVIVPNGESSLFLKVANPEATSGGTSQEFTRVTQADVDGAVANLNTKLAEAFTEAMADPSLSMNGAAVFPATGRLGPATSTVDPATLVGQEVATFDLGLSATGTVITADPGPVNGIAESQMQAAIKPGYQLVPGSVSVTVGDAIVVGQTVTFPVRAKAKQVAVLDPAALEAKVLGKPIADARAILAPYGDVQISVSPDWSGSIPSFESRVDLTVQGPVQIETPAPSPS